MLKVLDLSCRKFRFDHLNKYLNNDKRWGNERENFLHPNEGSRKRSLMPCDFKQETAVFSLN